MIVCAQGTALHAGMIAEYLFEDLAKIPCEVEYASELRYRNPPIIEERTLAVRGHPERVKRPTRWRRCRK